MSEDSLIFQISLECHTIHLLIHLSAHLYYHHHSHHPSLLLFFTPGSKPTFSTNSSQLRFLLATGLLSWQRDWTGPIMLIVLFLVSHFNFLFVPCGGLSWLPVSFLLHVKYTLSYRIVQLSWTHAYKGKGKGKGLDICYSATYMSQTRDQQHLQSRQWQLIGMSQWYRSSLCGTGHPLPALTDNWSHGAASRHTIAPISHTRPSARSLWCIIWLMSVYLSAR